MPTKEGVWGYSRTPTAQEKQEYDPLLRKLQKVYDDSVRAVQRSKSRAASKSRKKTRKN